jgi:hypothetical protein
MIMMVPDSANVDVGGIPWAQITKLFLVRATPGVIPGMKSAIKRACKDNFVDFQVVAVVPTIRVITNTFLMEYAIGMGYKQEEVLIYGGQ